MFSMILLCVLGDFDHDLTWLKATHMVCWWIVATNRDREPLRSMYTFAQNYDLSDENHDNKTLLASSFVPLVPS